ncbi:DUF4019 domain-containing protein [Sandarakinorhabdus limnophila]|uniref:DUF4019 domain-containing protein n=2 Tax=Sandarakinorhabdus limnophila TaxID=210512 RepID=UPI0003B4104F
MMILPASPLIPRPAPPHGYTVVKFRTDYARKAGAIETLSMAREGDGWRVAGIMID